MTTLNFLKDQVIETRSFTKRLMDEMPEELWYEIPENTNSNFAWQLGHILLAQNYHIISCCFGIDPQVFETIPIAKYAKAFAGMGSPIRSVKREFASPEKLKEQMEFIMESCLEKMGKADDALLSQPLEPTNFKNPIATKKYEALSWSFKHEMWHCAEMEQIKLALGKNFRWIDGG